MSKKNSNEIEVVESTDQLVDQLETVDTIEVVESDGWVSPLDVNYKELETILDGKELAEYVGNKLPDDEVKRIETDYKLYLKNK